MSAGLLGVAAAAVGASAALAAILIRLLHPLLVRYALARPNARSAHVVPTPQGGGLAVLIATMVTALAGARVLGAGLAGMDEGLGAMRLVLVLSAALLMAVVGLVDDLRPLPPLPRLLLQLVAMAMAVLALPDGARVLPALPFALERLLLVVGGAWFVNLTNFMDGMDWLTFAEMGPVTAALAVFWAWGWVSPAAGLLMMGLMGGLLGFAPSNRPVARLFLGDVGSLPIGLLVAYALYDLAGHGALAAALILPLYYIADSGLTLVWRLRRGERVWEAHRHHFYQVAIARGYRVGDVLIRVFVTNVVLAALAAASLVAPAPWVALLDVVFAALVVAWLLRDLARGRPAAGLEGQP